VCNCYIAAKNKTETKKNKRKKSKTDDRRSRSQSSESGKWSSPNRCVMENSKECVAQNCEKAEFLEDSSNLSERKHIEKRSQKIDVRVKDESCMRSEDSLSHQHKPLPGPQRHRKDTDIDRDRGRLAAVDESRSGYRAERGLHRRNSEDDRSRHSRGYSSTSKPSSKNHSGDASSRRDRRDSPAKKRHNRSKTDKKPSTAEANRRHRRHHQSPDR